MKNKLDNFIKTSLDKLYSEEPNLIKIDISDLIEVHNAERSIVFRFGHYMINLLERDEDLRLYQVDAEYNRNLYDIKRIMIDDKLKNVYPDLVIHRRGTSDNLLVIEFKTWWNPDQNFDIKKIKAFMKPSGGYAYKFGLLIKIDRTSPELCWIKL
ncbi:MAG: hypothetical protein LKE36_05330 [Bacilli bacterium]|jgi:hypothetical protein|nr:hypothetical protein [Bacilli bacterium]